MLANAVTSLLLKPLCLFSVALALTVTAAPAKQRGDNYTVAILLFDDVQIIDFSAPYEVFGQADFDVFTVSKDGNTVTTSMGLSVNPTYSFSTMPDADAILIPGGDVHEPMHDKATLAWLKQQQMQADHILSVCTGSHIVAESGLLDGLSATTFHRAIPGFADDYPKITVQPQKRFVDNGQIITSAGLSSGIDASLHLVSKVLGQEKAKSVALHIEYDWDPDGSFVRAMMADQYFPNNHYSWPDDILFNELSSVGDTTHWKKVYTATTSASADQLLQIYRAAMSEHDNWRLLTDSTDNHLSWTRSDKNQQWTHQVSIEPGDDKDKYYITILVEQTQGAKDA